MLLHGPAATAEPFKLAVLELVTRGALRLVDVQMPRRIGRAQRTSVLVAGPAAVRPAERPLAAVWDVYQAAPAQTFPDGTHGVPVAAFAKHALRSFRPIGAYASREVLSSLIDRGLYRTERGKVLFLFPVTKHVLTPEGTRARADLQRWLDTGKRDLAGWVDGDSGQAMAYVAGAGAAVLLAAPLYPHLQQLGAQLGPDGASLDAAGFDGPEFDFSAFDSLGSAFESIDSGVDAGSGDSGDAGGGDSGGGD